MNDITQITRARLEAAGQTLTAQDIIKLASDAAVQRLAAAQVEHQVKTSRVKQSKELVTATIDSIIKTSQAKALYEAGALQLDPSGVAALNQALVKAAEDVDAIADAVAEGDQAEQELVAGLIEAAAADPEQAAALLADAGDPMSAEEIVQAASDLAEVTDADESGDEIAEKTSSGARARLVKIASTRSELAGEVITRMAENLRILAAQG